MGQKVHPYGFRLGISKPWKANWFSDQNYAEFLEEDLKIRNYIKNKYFEAGIGDILIERPSSTQINITIKAVRVGIIIGRKGAEIQALKNEIEKLVNDRNVRINIDEIKNPQVEAVLIAENIAAQILKRASYKRAMKRAISAALKKGAKGIKIMVSGRLNGAEIARTEWYMEGRLPLQTLRSDIDYGTAEAQTLSGTIGIKVWVYKGDTQL
ncbi:30S ribosomal protein S3 [Marinitoga litoralis]|uniref:30S ribosomal protein S3 n=1 Tax=Marinitoga litoralis TaxID=570855 RepID=UPI001960CF4F|nr:small subunit ribosomal protein S3 [Marinitoga litoralis]